MYGNLQPAFSRHKKTHHFSKGAEIEVRKPLGKFEHVRCEPSFLIDSSLDIFQRDVCLFRRCTAFLHSDDKAFNLSSAKGNEHTPANIHKRKPCRYAIAISLRDTLDRDIDKNFCDFLQNSLHIKADIAAQLYGFRNMLRRNLLCARKVCNRLRNLDDTIVRTRGKMEL